MNEFSSQPSAGQVLSSSESIDTDPSSTDWGTVFQKSIGSDNDSQTKVKRFKAKSSERVFQSKLGSDMLDQTFINDRILSQLDAISRHLDAIENTTASAHVGTLQAPPRGKKGQKTADSNLKLSVDSSVRNSDVNLPDLKSIRHDKFIQQQVEECIKQLSPCTSNNDGQMAT